MHLRNKSRRVAAVLLVLMAGAITYSIAGSAHAVPLDTIDLTSPNNVTIAESDDYATQVLQDPWDMNNLDDIDIRHLYNPPSVGNGIWSANTTGDAGFNNGAFFQLQYQNFRQNDNGTIHTFYSYPGEKDGINYPISTSQYTHLRARIYVSGVGQRNSVLWFYGPYGEAPLGNSNFLNVTPGWHIYELDLRAGGSGGSGNWSSLGSISGMRFDLNPDVPNNNVQIDWVRLTPPNGSRVNINWTFTGAGTSTVNLYLSTSPDPNANEMLIGTAQASASSFVWDRTGIAPGTYYIHAEMNGARDSSGPLHVNTAPLLKIDSPGTASGEDFAQATRGMNWDGATTNQFESTRNVTDPVFTGAHVEASATNSDPQLMWVYRNTTNQIDTDRYRFMTIRWKLLAPAGLPINEGYNAGPRMTWERTPTSLAQQTEASLAFYNVWTNMAWDLETVQLTPPNNGEGWRDRQSTLRFDVHEQHIAGGREYLPQAFFIQSAHLTSYPYSDRATLVRWTPLQGGGLVDLYWDNDNQGFNGTRFAQGVSMSSGLAKWDTAGLPNGTYWVYAVSQDGRNSSQVYSLVPMKVDHSGVWKSTIFSDVPNNYFAANTINYMATQGYVIGYPQPDGSAQYRPFNSATRSQLSKMVVLAANYALVSPTNPTFADVPSSNSLYIFVETAVANGVVGGYPCGGAGEPCGAGNKPYFRPNSNVTRAQTAKMISVSRGWSPQTPAQPTFADVSPGNNLYGYVEASAGRGIIGGYACGGAGEPCDAQNRPYYRPGNNVTRAQLSKMLSCSLGGGAPCN